ncbi:SLC13 family permease [Hallella sp.]|uniref:SLC13 family permease n=1 Tax=Hallella sp. TaxID=2980186 RepID=UPI00258C0E01|nr:SLC13 family permease [Hallella sp.]MDD7145657.1 SLC13 family permease [Hallella sp.]MDY5924371.1 SLC13 family permease [Hallella sp.]
MIATLIILALSAVFFAMGKVRSDLVALCALVALLLTGTLTPQEAISGFSNQVVIMMVGLFVVGGAIVQTGLAKKASGKLMMLAGDNEIGLFLLLMVVTAVIGAFVSNTGTVALMMPIVVSLAQKAKIRASRLLMPLAFASSMGGMLTLIGTPPNLVIQEALTESGHQPLGFFSFLPVGLVCIVVGIVVLLPLSKRFLNGRQRGDDDGKARRRKTLDDLLEEYSLKDDLSVFTVTDASLVKDKSIVELDVQRRYGLSVLEVRRVKKTHAKLMKEVEQRLAGPDTRLMVGDIVYVSGNKQQAEQMAADMQLNKTSQPLAFYDIGIAEAVLMHNSRLCGKTLRDGGLRRLYSVNVLGVRRGDDYITRNLADLKLRQGDILLIQGKWKNISRIANLAEGILVMGQPLEEAARVTLDYKAPLAAAIMVAMILTMVFDFIPVAPVTAVITAGLLMVLTGCIRSVEAAYKTINWESIVLIAAMLPMSVALEKTGASALVARMLADGLGQASPYALLAGVYFTTSLLTMFISNTATAVLMSPIALTSAMAIGVSPYPMLFAVTLGASMCFASPFSTPPNALVMQAGGYTFMDYIKVGLPLQIIMGLVMVFVLPLLFPF